jgi:hypothetical protein
VTHKPPYITCSLCGLGLHSFAIIKHVGKTRCLAQQETTRQLARGLHLAKLRYQNKSDHTAEALRLFDLPVELHATGLHGGMQPWTTEHGVALALTIEEAARLLSTSYPEAARRLHERPELIGPFGTAWRLGGAGDDSDILRRVLEPIDYVIGSDGKRRPTKRAPGLSEADWDGMIADLEADE